MNNPVLILYLKIKNNFKAPQTGCYLNMAPGGGFNSLELSMFHLEDYCLAFKRINNETIYVGFSLKK